MTDPHIKTLTARLTELEWFAKQNNHRIEPYLYPKGLFQVTHDSKKCFVVSAYVTEIKEGLQRLKQCEDSLLYRKLAETILQKISVLTVSFRSQYLRRHKKSSLQDLFNQVASSTDNTYQYFCEKEGGVSSCKLKNQIKVKKKDLEDLKASIKTKKTALMRMNTLKEKEHLQKVLLALMAEMAFIEKEIEADKKQLSQLE